MRLLRADYINHNGQTIEFGKEEGLFLNEHDLFNFSWDYQTRGNKIVSVSRDGIRENNLPLIIVAQSKERAIKLANDLFSICEVDMIANQKGEIIVNDYRLKCFIRGQDYTQWADPANCIKISAKVIRDSIWYKTLDPITFNENSLPPANILHEHSTNNASLSGETNSDSWTGGEKGYYYGYPYDYAQSSVTYVFNNNYKIPLSWQAIIYGPASLNSIEFSIGGHVYSVNTSLGRYERLEITAKESQEEKTVVKVQADGTRVNCFADRNTESYLFERIQPGEQIIRYDVESMWRLIPIIERSSPEWL